MKTTEIHAGGTGHEAWFRDVRRILDITEVTPGLPLPRIAPDRVTFFFVGITHGTDARQAMTEAETILRSALPVAFYPHRTQTGSLRHYILTALMPSGLEVDLVARGEHYDGADTENSSDIRELVAA